MKKLYFMISFVYLYNIAISQNNLIPNGGFELGAAVPTCNYSVTLNGFDNAIYNWKFAPKG